MSSDIYTRDIQPRTYIPNNKHSRRMVKYINALLNELFWFQNLYEWSETSCKFKRRDMISEQETLFEDIQDCYWLYKSSSDTYQGLIKLKNGYGYFKAISGFNGLVESSLVLYKAPTREILIQYAMSNKAYMKYIKKTIPN